MLIPRFRVLDVELLTNSIVRHLVHVLTNVCEVYVVDRLVQKACIMLLLLWAAT
jgi:hypothetical protein